MKNNKSESEDAIKLRQKAEEIFSKRKTEDAQPMSDEEARALVHELQVHQIELEMQGEELRQAYQESEKLRDKYFTIYHLAPVGYITIDEQGSILTANLAITQLLGIEMRSFISRRFQVFIAPEAVAMFNEFCGDTLKKDTKQSCEVRLVKDNAPSVYVRLEGSVIEDSESPGRQRILVSISDITKMKETEEKLRKLIEELEQRVKERTAELETQLAEKERMNKLFVGRELRMIELKEKIKDLEGQAASSKGQGKG